MQSCLKRFMRRRWNGGYWSISNDSRHVTVSEDSDKDFWGACGWKVRWLALGWRSTWTWRVFQSPSLSQSQRSMWSAESHSGICQDWRSRSGTWIDSMISWWNLWRITNVQYKAGYISSDVTASGEYSVTASVHIMQQTTITCFPCGHTNWYWNVIMNCIVI